MSKEQLDRAAEAVFKAACAEVYENTFQQLRVTLRKGWNPKDGGYGETVEEARFNIIDQADKQLTRMASAHLKKVGR